MTTNEIKFSDVRDMREVIKAIQTHGKRTKTKRWRLVLSCGHSVFRKWSAKPPKNVRSCEKCWSNQVWRSQ